VAKGFGTYALAKGGRNCEGEVSVLAEVEASLIRERIGGEHVVTAIRKEIAAKPKSTARSTTRP
jgi:hypothetical protein